MEFVLFDIKTNLVILKSCNFFLPIFLLFSALFVNHLLYFKSLRARRFSIFQEVTRARKGWALDCVVLHNDVTRFFKDDITQPPAEGVYVHGLYLDGAGWDRRGCKLVEPTQKVLFTAMPVIHIYAINTTAGRDARMYQCPIYKKPRRTDLTYIASVDLKTNQNPDHWILRGVALLCDIK